MESLKETPTLKFNPNTLQEVRKLYDLDKPGRMEEAIRLLEDWIQKQEHFMTKKFDGEYLERLLIANKGLVERCKSKLDKLCTFRTLLPEYFGYCDIKEIINVPHYNEGMYDTIISRLTPDNYRVYLLKLDDVTYLPELTFTYIRIMFLVWEYVVRHDYSAGYIVIIDIRNISIMEYMSKFNVTEARKVFTVLQVWEYVVRHDYSAGYIVIIDIRNISIMEYMSKFNVTEARKVFTVLQEGYGMRIKGLHYLSNSKLVEGLISLTKSIVSPKLAQRIHIHTTLDSLLEVVPKEVLCAEYGGNEIPFFDSINRWIDVLSSQEHKDYMKFINECRTDDSKRIGEKISDQYLPGSFRTLIVD